MKLFDYYHCYDYGHEWYLNIGCTNLFNVLQFNLDWSDYFGRPILLINVLGESFCGFTLTIGKFTFSFDLFAYRQRDLNWYRNI